MADPAPDVAAVLTMRRESRPVEQVDEPTRKLVIVTLGEELFAFAGGSIREILPRGPIHFVPGAPPALAGVINLRGDILSVLRLDALLERERADPPGGAILLGVGLGLTSGLLADRVEDVLDVVESAIHPPPDALPLRELVRGVLDHHGRTVTLLDLDSLFQAFQRVMPPPPEGW